MSTESYVDSIRHQVTERNEKARMVVDVLRGIIRDHAIFDHDSEGNPMGTPSAFWDQERPREVAWLRLYNSDSGQIEEAAVADRRDDKEFAVSCASFVVCELDADLDDEVMTIETLPPNVRGYDGAPLNSSQLDGAIADLRRYEGALKAGRIEP